MARQAEDLSGRTFGQLTVQAREGNAPSGPALWRCACSCGASKLITSSNLKSGSYSTCGDRSRHPPTPRPPRVKEVVVKPPTVRKNAVLLELEGRSQSLTEWAKELNVPVETFKARRKLGWSDVDILTTPVGARSTGDHTLDRTGKTFGRLTAIELSGKVGKRVFWKCLCSCEPGGKEVVVRSDKLVEGANSSCGCLQREASRTHGKFGSRIYEIWSAMKKRCYLTTAPNYARYGGRGIGICQEWRDSFEAFYADMGDPPTDKHTLDREDNDGDYTPANCRWATAEEQQNNRSSNTFLEYDGKRLTVAQWGRLTGLGKSAILQRIARGWDVARTLTTPVKLAA